MTRAVDVRLQLAENDHATARVLFAKTVWHVLKACARPCVGLRKAMCRGLHKGLVSWPAQGLLDIEPYSACTIECLNQPASHRRANSSNPARTGLNPVQTTVQTSQGSSQHTQRSPKNQLAQSLRHQTSPHRAHASTETTPARTGLKPAHTKITKALVHAPACTETNM